MAVETWDDVAAAKRVRKVIEDSKLNLYSPGGLMDCLRAATAGNGAAARKLQNAIEAIPVEQRVNVVGFALKPYELTVRDVPGAPLGIVVQAAGRNDAGNDQKSPAEVRAS